MPPDFLPTYDVSSPQGRIRHAVITAMAWDGSAREHVVTWLCDDVLALMDLYVRATGATSVRTHLQVVRDDMCRTFHVDQVAYSPLTTYWGPGTQWISPRMLATAALNQSLDADQISDLDRGIVAILRSAREATLNRRGVLPPLPRPSRAPGAVRLFLSINEVAA